MLSKNKRNKSKRKIKGQKYIQGFKKKNELTNRIWEKKKENMQTNKIKLKWKIIQKRQINIKKYK